MRILESMKIPFSQYTYTCEKFTDALQIELAPEDLLRAAGAEYAKIIR